MRALGWEGGAPVYTGHGPPDPKIPVIMPTHRHWPHWRTLSPALSGQESSRRSGHSDTGSMAETPMSTLVTGDEGALASGGSGGSSLHWTDYLVIVGYFMSVIVVSSFGMRWNKVSRYFQSSFNVLRSGLCHHSKVKETQWTVIFWQAGAWIGSR